MARNIKVCSIALDDWKMLECPNQEKDILNLALERIDTASAGKPDLICLPEAFAFSCIPAEKWRQKAELYELLISAIKEKAKKYSVHILCPTITISDDEMYNCAVLIDNEGRTIGQYEKMFPTIEEIDVGIKAGKKAKVFDTSLGRIGVIICFDLNFCELAEQYRKLDAEMLIFCSMFDGGSKLSALASNNNTWLVSSVFNGSNKVIDPIGAIRAESSLHQPILYYDINLDSRIYHIDYNKSRIEKMQTKYGLVVNIHCYFGFDCRQP